MITTRVEGFTGRYSSLNGVRNLPIGRLDLARAVVTVGHQNYRQVAGAGAFRLLSLFSMTLASVRLEDGRLRLTEGFDHLESTEKGVTSYYLGQGLTKATAWHLLRIPWLSHVRLLGGNVGYLPALSRSTKPRFAESRGTAREPDLIGFDDRKAPHVFEAKGYSSGFRPEVMQHAIDQVSTVDTVNGKKPATRTACFFDLTEQRVVGTVVDPNDHIVESGSREDGTRLTFRDFLISYYLPFLEDSSWENAEVLEWAGREYRVMRFGLDFQYGLDAAVLAALQGRRPVAGTFDALRGDARRGEAEGTEATDEIVSVGPDGTILVSPDETRQRFRESLEHLSSLALKRPLSSNDVGELLRYLEVSDPMLQILAADLLGHADRIDDRDAERCIEALIVLLPSEYEDVANVASASLTRWLAAQPGELDLESIEQALNDR